ncbi:LamG domain-containing protein [bacterium]|nr:LamG domain-containing protein [Akkermansiaceae bacterium]MDB4437460.1 LamG domain-containing protein [bacterium]
MIKFNLSAIFLATFASQTWADVTISDDAPVDALAESTAFGTTGSRIFDIDANANHGRGNRFILPGGVGTSFQIDSVTIQASGTQTYLDDTLTLFIYQGTSADFNAGTGHTEESETYYEGTTVTPLTEESFTFSGSPTAGQYVTIALTTPIIVNDASDFGFFFIFDQGSGSNTSFFYQESGSPTDPNDGRTSVTEGGHGTAASRQMNYYVNGVTLDAGILVPSIVSSSTLIEGGESVTLDISFDTTVDSALLDTPSGSVDLLALDAADATPDDGEVSLIESPASTFTYEVTLARAGDESKSADLQVIVIDPANSPADNVFSTAIKDSSPLFYYRFEEATDAGYLLDSSGNSHHTNDFRGALAQGTGPGGMQNASYFDGASGVVTPATSQMNESFTISAVVNTDRLTGLPNLFSMTNGDGVGRSILYIGNNGFETFIAGSAVSLSDSSVIATGDSCLFHYVYDADPDQNPATDDQEIRIYANGALYGTPTAINPVAVNEGNWVLGTHKTISIQRYEGWLDETAVFESALTDSQIAAHGTAFFMAADPLLSFTADTLDIAAGEPITLTWKTSETATAVTLNGNPVDGAGEGGTHTTTVFPSFDTTYTLEASGPGGPFTRSLTATVEAPPAPPSVTSITSDLATPPNLTITISGTPNTSYNVKASEDLNDGFPENVTTVTTDDAGVGTKTFEGVGTKEFYRLEAQ